MPKSEPRGARVQVGWVEALKRFRDMHHLKPLMTILIYLVAPLVSFQLVLAQYPQLDPSRFRFAATYIIPLGLLLTSISIAQERFPKGTLFRLYLDGAFVTLSMLWLLSILGGAPIIHSSYEGHPFSIDVTPIFALAVGVAGANFVYDFLEYRYYKIEGGDFGGAVSQGPEDHAPGLPCLIWPAPAQLEAAEGPNVTSPLSITLTPSCYPVWLSPVNGASMGCEVNFSLCAQAPEPFPTPGPLRAGGVEEKFNIRTSPWPSENHGEGH
ncbi:MAG: hypothetical protein QXH42_05770 [Thermoplasmata archaeon]